MLREAVEAGRSEEEKVKKKFINNRVKNRS